MHDTAFIVFSGLSLVLVLLPSPWHIRSGNTGTILNISWLFTANLIYFVNAIVWWDNVGNWAPVWCDIYTKILVGLAPGISTSSLCINRRLAIIATASSPVTGHRAKQKAMVIDLLMGLGIPALVMACSYVTQPQRYDLDEGIGCYESIWPALPGIFLVSIWPVILGLISAIYGGIAVNAFISRRLQFNSILKGSQSGLNTSRFLRLIALASTDIVVTVPLSIYFLVIQIRALVPWKSWAQIHNDFDIIPTHPASLWNSLPDSQTTGRFLPRWVAPLGAIVFFAFFGIAEDAIGEYFAWWYKACEILGIQQHAQVRPKYIPTLGTTIERSQNADAYSEVEKQELPITEPVNIDAKAEYLGVAVDVERHVV